MQQLIKQQLKTIEQEKNVKVLYAIESGSRAWGFASQNSDWDVRFIYIHPQEWYLRIDRGKDNYNKILDNDLDLSGWELQKALKLLRKSNPPLQEWLDSSIVYYADEAFLSRMRSAAKYYFNPKSCMYHYLSMLKNNTSTYLLGNTVILKKYFYALRPIFAIDYIIRYQQFPPILFDTLLEASDVSNEIRFEIDKLLVQKRKSVEKDVIPANQTLNHFIHTKTEAFQNYLNNFSFKKETDNLLLNELFLTELKRFEQE